MKSFALAVALFLTLPGLAAAETSDGIAVQEAWARATPPGVRTGVVYLTLQNKGAAADQLVSASTPVAAEASPHTEIMNGSVMKMRALKSIDLAPGATVTLEPGGKHLMLTGLKRALKKGEHFPLTLRFAHAAPITVQVDVARVGASMPDMPGMNH